MFVGQINSDMCRRCKHKRTAHSYAGNCPVVILGDDVRIDYNKDYNDPSCQPKPVQSSAMSDPFEAASQAFGQPVVSTVAQTVEKGIRNYPIDQTQATAMSFGAYMPMGSTTVMGQTNMRADAPVVPMAVPLGAPIWPAVGSNGYVSGGATSGVIRRTTIDPVNPKHYRGDLVMRIIEHFGLEENFYLGNVIKYILRHAQKAGLTDLEKAAWYLQRAIDVQKGTIKPGLSEMIDGKSAR